MKLAAYVRVSTQEQGNSGLGLEAQRAGIEAWCLAMGHTIGEWFEDVASGASADRVALLAAREACEDGRARGLVALKLDRLTRSVRDLADLLDWADDCGVTVCSVRDSFDASSGSGRLVANILACVAQWERETIAERTRDALQAKRARGEWVGSAPLGCTRDRSGRLTPADAWRPVFDAYARLGCVTFTEVGANDALARPDGRGWSESGWRRFRKSAELLR